MGEKENSTSNSDETMTLEKNRVHLNRLPPKIDSFKQWQHCESVMKFSSNFFSCVCVCDRKTKRITTIESEKSVEVTEQLLFALLCNWKDVNWFYECSLEYVGGSMLNTVFAVTKQNSQLIIGQLLTTKRCKKMYTRKSPNFLTEILTNSNQLICECFQVLMLKKKRKRNLVELENEIIFYFK